MEWVETTGRTIEEALDAALDELGVDADDVEYEVLVEPRAGLFGRIGGSEARLRARVKPISREKPGDRRRRTRKQQGRGGRGGARPGGDAGGEGRSVAEPRPQPSDPSTDAGAAATGSGRSRRRRRGGSAGIGRIGWIVRVRVVPVATAVARAAGNRVRASSASATTGERTVDEASVTIDQQAEAAEVFTRGLIDAWGADAQDRGEGRGRRERARRRHRRPSSAFWSARRARRSRRSRSSCARSSSARPRVTASASTSTSGGYQAKRRAALESFVRDIAHKVIESGRDHALEPMTPSDRKVVHDAVSDIDGVTTISEGEEPRRRVVLRRASA